MKKIICVVLLILIAFANTGFAIETIINDRNVRNVVFERAEIKDLDVLFNRAINNISDVPVNNNNGKAKTKDLISGAELDVSTVSTTQLLKVVENESGIVEKSYSIATFTLLPEEEVIAMNSGYRRRDRYANTGEVRLYSIVNYTEHYNYPVVHYSMQSASGGIVTEKSGVNYISRTANSGVVGFSDYYPYYANWSAHTSNFSSYTHWVPSHVVPISSHGDGQSMGTYIETRYTYLGQTKTLSLSNYIVGLQWD